MEDYRRYLDPKVLNRISGLDLKARLIVEGYVTGLHKSPYHGFSIEFAEHREYVPGDDIRHVDWKVFGRSDRYYIKQYEEETNLVCNVLLDVSESMRYAGDTVSKLEYGSYVAAAICYLVIKQQDSAGMVLFDETIRRHVKPSSNPSHLKSMLHDLAEVTPREKTNLGRVLHEIAEKLGKKGLVVLISDLFDEPDSILAGLRHLRHRGHDTIVFHVLDHYERVFPFERITLFDGLEAGPEVIADPRALREAYLGELEEFRRRIRRGCQGYRIDYVELDTATTLDVALSSYLASRAARRK
jgi:uncharacterized protein (DUF58 family)